MEYHIKSYGELPVLAHPRNFIAYGDSQRPALSSGFLSSIIEMYATA